jgi:hypothetical protein
LTDRWRYTWPKCFRHFMRPDNTDTSNYVERLFRDVFILFLASYPATNHFQIKYDVFGRKIIRSMMESMNGLIWEKTHHGVSLPMLIRRK